MGSNLAFRHAMEAIRHLSDHTPPWNDILATARDLVGADAGTLLMFDKRQDLLLLQQVGNDAAAEQEYRQYFHTQDTVAKAGMSSPAGTWLDSTQMLPASVMRKNAYHADYLARSRIGQVLAFIIQNEESVKAGLSFQRATLQTGAVSALTHGPVADYTQALMKALAQRRQAATVQLEAIESAFMRMGEATFLATRSGVVWRLSPLAKELLQAGKMLADGADAITHADQKMTQRLRHALAQAASTGNCAGLTVPIGWGEMYRLDIAPAHASILLGGEGILFVRICKRSAFAVPDVLDLCVNFSITPAEARVLAALVSGHSASEHALSAGVAERTVRNQIASLMLKMGCSRQSELVRLASML